MTDQVFEDTLDEELDLAGEGLRTPDEVDLAEDRADRLAGESQTKPAEEEVKDEDLTDEQFAYTLPDGTEFQGTVEEIAGKIAELKAAEVTGPSDLEAKVKELEAKLEQVGKPVETKVEETPVVQSVDWSKTGDLLASRLGIDPDEMNDGERKMLGEIGPMMDDAIHRTVLSSPAIASTIVNAVSNVVNQILDQREGKTKTQSAFEEFIGGDKFTDVQIADFQKSHPFANTREMAIMGLKMDAQAKGVATKVKEVEEAEKKGKKTGAEQTIKDLKATGRLRRIAGLGTTGSAKPNKPGNVPRTEGERLNSWAADLKTRLGAT